MKSEAPVPQDHIVSTEFEGGEGVLVDLHTKRYYQLNETAMTVWRHLEKRKSLEEIIQHLLDVYDVTGEHATASVQKLFQHLQAHHLVRAPQQAG